MREDCLADLRVAVAAQRAAGAAGERGAVRGCVRYRDARVVQLAFSRRGVGWRLRFAPPGGRQRGVQPNRLMTGSLLVLADAADVEWRALVFAVVSNRTDALLAHALGPFVDIEVVAGDGGVHFDPSRTYTMLESTAYYGAYRPVLEALRELSEDPTKMPFAPNLLCATLEVPPPAYLFAGGRAPRLLLQEAFPGNDTLHAAHADGVNVLGQWPAFAHTLDASQLQAVELALRHSVALIQGPPGCGKTFVGVISSSSRWASGATARERRRAAARARPPRAVSAGSCRRYATSSRRWRTRRRAGLRRRRATSSRSRT
jgi:helicase required for RNAi-mediated heterochromatin assembly 1